MLDSDLAKLYECKNVTKEINQAVKNNLEKFPERFSWQLTEDELKYLRSKFLTTNYSNMSRSMPRVFTEQGNKQYNNLKVIYNNTFHDRYFIIDDNKIYHCGASVNRIGNKTFSINLITDNEVNNLLLNKVKKLIEGK